MQTASLGDLVSIQTGKLDANASSPDGAYPFFTCAREPLRIASWKYDLDAVLVAGNGDLNVKHYKGKFDAYQRTYIISPKTETAIFTRYLFYFMDSYLETLREQSIGGIIKYIKLGMLTDAKIPLPPLEEQKRIAAILDQADDIRRKRQHAIERLNQLGQAIFHEMFGDPATVSGWKHDCREIAAVCEKVTDGTHQAPKWSDAGVPFIFVSNVRDHKIDLNTKKFVSKSEYLNLTKNAKIDSGDVLYTCVGSYGYTAVVDGKNEFAFQRHIAHLKPNKSLLQSLYLSWCLEAPKIRQQADKLATGIAQKTVTLKALKAIRIPLPPLEAQIDFSNRILVTENNKEVLERDLRKMDSLFASLQNRAFTGELLR